LSQRALATDRPRIAAQKYGALLDGEVMSAETRFGSGEPIGIPEVSAATLYEAIERVIAAGGSGG
jgi:hypothetical protein